MADLQEHFKNVLWHGHEFESSLKGALDTSRINEDWEKLMEIINKTEEVLHQSKLEIQKRYPPARTLYSSGASILKSASASSSSTSNYSRSAIVDSPVQILKGFNNNITQSASPQPQQQPSYRNDNRQNNNNQNNVHFNNKKEKPKPADPARKNFFEEDHKNEKKDRELDPYRIFLPNVSPSTTDNNLRSTFEHFGRIREARTFKKDGAPNRNGIIWFESQETVKQLMQKTFVVDGAEVKVAPFYNKTAKSSSTVTQGSSKSTETLTESIRSHKIDPKGSARNVDPSGKCIICKNSKVNCILLWCGHSTTCSDCGEKLKVCPKCGESIAKITKL